MTASLIFLVSVPDMSFSSYIHGRGRYLAGGSVNHSPASHTSSPPRTFVDSPYPNSSHHKNRSEFVENVNKKNIPFKPQVAEAQSYGFMPVNLASVSSSNPPSLQEQLYASRYRKMDVPRPNPIKAAMPGDGSYSQGGIEMPCSNPERVTPNSVVSNDGRPLRDVRPQQSSLSSDEGATQFCPVQYPPQQQAQMYPPPGDRAKVMIPPVMPVRLQGRMLQFPQQQAHHMQYRTGINPTQQQQMDGQLYMPHSNPYFHRMNPNFNNQMLSVPPTNAAAIAEQSAQIDGLKGSVYPPSHDFGGRSEVVGEITSKPQIISVDSSSHSVHNFKPDMATATSTGSSGMVSEDHVTKVPVPPASAWNSSSMSGRKNYTVASHPAGKHGSTPVGGGGAGECGRGGDVSGAVVGSSNVVDIKASFGNLSSGTPIEAEESLETCPGDFLYLLSSFFSF